MPGIRGAAGAVIGNGLCHPTVETLDGVQGGSVARRPLAPALWQADRDNRLRADGPEREC